MNWLKRMNGAGKGDVVNCGCRLPFIYQRIRSVIGFEQVRRVDLVSRFPCVVTFGVSFPFDEVLELSRPPMTSVVEVIEWGRKGECG